MSGGWATSTRSSRLPPNWRELCRQVRLLYGSNCYLCGHVSASDTDHVERGDDHRVENLRPICGARCTQCKAERRPACHVAKSSHEGGQAAGAQAKRRAELKRRPQEKHPGLR